MAQSNFKKLVHYICWSASGDPSKLGSVKLNKVLWLADFEAYHHFGKSITGASYIKRKFGPVPKAILPVLDELQREGALTIHESKYHGYSKKEFRVDKPADSTFLTEKEKDLVSEVMSFVCDQHTAMSISQLSHDHVWKAAIEGEEIPYFTVFARPGTVTQEDRDWALEHLQLARSA